MRYISPPFRRRSLRGLIVLGAAAVGLSAPIAGAHAQVTTSRNALDALGAPRRPAMLPDGGSMSASPTGTTTSTEGGSTPAASSTGGHATGDIPGSHAPATAIASPAAIAALPPVAAQPPANPVLRPPELHVPLHPFPMPPEVKADPQARGRAEKIAGGTRLHFTPQSAEMNPRMISALQTFATVMQKLPDQHISIAAYGEGRADDPSTPRRVALSRGLAARSVLLHAGIAPTRIYVRAVGLPDENAHGAGADCIDVTRSGVVASNATGSPSR
ncbi:OmpA family protein [Komagataeibacter swingsii]|uniref:OmpA-like domain-containing protein n=1 Tax=Komagataeibacter swingsii TaxID=215220 RepID=A0A2V4R516_9PROT|nr:hypothetical protein [Komagataeibacter swingsii]PYD69853.1 hypothetical protein CFR76_07385 [Komagataeibacter swingsii]GBQ61055.1 hypothetical protein AA16373_2078 [Komagataeibacter swingsii DSM 16373]